MAPKKFGAGTKTADKPLNTKGVWESKSSKVGKPVEHPNLKTVVIDQVPQSSKPINRNPKKDVVNRGEATVAEVTVKVIETEPVVISTDAQIVAEQTDTTALMKELQRAETVVNSALATGKLDELFAYGDLLNSVEGVAGVAKMRLMYLMEAKWPEFQAKKLVEDDWQNVAQAHMKITPANAKKYARAWGKLYEGRLIPDTLRGVWLSKPVEHWLRITPAAVTGLSKAQWQKATTARYGREIADIAKTVRGSKTSSKTRLTIQLRRKTGELRAWRGSGKAVTIGTLKTDAESMKNPTISDAVARILSGVGIVEE